MTEPLRLFYCGLTEPDDDLGKVGSFYRNVETHEVWGPKTKAGWPKESLGIHKAQAGEDHVHTRPLRPPKET